MKIKNVSVERFGVWNGLHLEELSDSITVIYGRNEAGKTTLMQFLRTMLFGAGCDGRHRYLNGNGGGQLQVETQTGLYNITRNFQLPKQIDQHRSTGRQLIDRTAVTTTDGNSENADTLQLLLSGIDESVYRNVYAIGLREIQQLGTLSDTEAGRRLYDLSAGVDRVSLVDVLRQLRLSRQNLLGSEDEPSVIGDLLQKKITLDKELEQLAESLGRYQNLATERTRLANQIEELEKDHASQSRQQRVTETAFVLNEKWYELQDVQRQYDQMGELPVVTSEDLAEVEQLHEQIKSQRRKHDQLKSQREQLAQQVASIPISSDLDR
ncbi:MAG: AAA family ATPase, partial [Planctomycetales bacterium]